MFPVTVTITLNNESDLITFASLSKGMSGPHEALPAQVSPQPEDGAPEQDKQTEQTPTAKPEPKAKVKKDAAATEAPAKAVANAPAAPDAPTEIPYAQAAAAVKNLILIKGRDAGVALLSRFGVPSLRDAKPEQYAGVIAACEQALAEDAQEGAAA